LVLGITLSHIPGNPEKTSLILQFVDEKVQWMHIDMAGPVSSEKKRTATGFGILTLVEWVQQHSS
jgi:leucyl aminopeptidase